MILTRNNIFDKVLESDKYKQHLQTDPNYIELIKIKSSLQNGLQLSDVRVSDTSKAQTYYSPYPKMVMSKQEVYNLINANSDGIIKVFNVVIPKKTRI